MYRINHANIKDWAANYDGPLFDGILCDPPYELGFMGKSWDSSGIAFDTEMWADLFKLLKPGAHLLAFSGSRTYHRMAVAIEDAGFEIRDMIEYIYGSGFPKSTNIYKQLKKQCTCGSMEAYENGAKQDTKHDLRPMQDTDIPQTSPTKGEAELVLQSSVSEQGVHGTVQGQKPSQSIENGEEPSVEGRSDLQEVKGQLQGSDIPEVSREVSTDGEKGRLHNATQASDGSTPGQTADENGSGTSHRPQSEQQSNREPCAFCKQWGTQAARSYGTGSALKPAHEPICLARKPLEGTLASNYLKHGTGGLNIDGTRVGTEDSIKSRTHADIRGGNLMSHKGNKEELGEFVQNPLGRFPANLIHDGSDEVEAVFPQSNGRYGAVNSGSVKFKPGEYSDGQKDSGGIKDKGSASRFFYCAKASKSERNAGLEGFEEKMPWTVESGSTLSDSKLPNANHHPTVKPLSLTKYLATLIKPPIGGRLLVPFSGSGSEMIGALQAGWEYAEGVELTEEYIPIAEARIEYWLAQMNKQLEIL